MYRLFQQDVRRDTSGRDKTNVTAAPIIRWKELLSLVFFQFVWICHLSEKKDNNYANEQQFSQFIQFYTAKQRFLRVIFYTF